MKPYRPVLLHAPNPYGGGFSWFVGPRGEETPSATPPSTEIADAIECRTVAEADRLATYLRTSRARAESLEGRCAILQSALLACEVDCYALAGEIVAEPVRDARRALKNAGFDLKAAEKWACPHGYRNNGAHKFCHCWESVTSANLVWLVVTAVKEGRLAGQDDCSEINATDPGTNEAIAAKVLATWINLERLALDLKSAAAIKRAKP